MGENMLLSVAMVAEKIRMACLQAYRVEPASDRRRCRPCAHRRSPFRSGSSVAAGPRRWIPRIGPRRQGEMCRVERLSGNRALASRDPFISARARQSAASRQGGLGGLSIDTEFGQHSLSTRSAACPVRVCGATSHPIGCEA